MRLIVLDTTETHGRLNLKGASIDALVRYALTHNSVIGIPEIVIEESIKHYRVEMDEGKKLARLAPRLFANPDFNPTEEVARYSEELRRNLSAAPFRILPYAQLSIVPLAKHSLARRKPFKSGGTGFQDAILWHSIVDFARHNEIDEVIFVTNNHKDFGEHGPVSDVLGKDFVDAGLDPARVTICKDIKRLLEETVLPSLASLDRTEAERNRIEAEMEKAVDTSLDVERFFNENRTAIEESVAALYENYHFNSGGRPAGRYYRPLPNGARFRSGLKSHDRWNVYRVDETKIGVRLTLYVDGQIDCGVNPECDEFAPGEDFFQFDYLFWIHMLLVWNESTGEVEQWEVMLLELEG